MILQKHFTGRWKNMNMAKLGTVLFQNAGMGNNQNIAQTRINKGLRVIHYAQYDQIESGTVHGTVSHFTEQRLAASPFWGSISTGSL